MTLGRRDRGFEDILSGGTIIGCIFRTLTIDLVEARSIPLYRAAAAPTPLRVEH